MDKAGLLRSAFASFIVLALLLPASEVCHAQAPSAIDAAAGVLLDEEKAKKGDASAQFRTGVAYFFGKVHKENLEEALYWVTKAADQGHVKAAAMAGQMYSEGLGAPKRTWMQRLL